MIARSFARIHQQNLVNFGVLPLTFLDDTEYGRVAQGDRVRIANLRGILRASQSIAATIGGHPVTLCHDLSPRQLDVLLAGGVINWLRQTILAIHQFPLRTVDGWSLRVMQGLRLFSGAGSTGGWNEWDRCLGGRDQG